MWMLDGKVSLCRKPAVLSLSLLKTQGLTRQFFSTELQRSRGATQRGRSRASGVKKARA